MGNTLKVAVVSFPLFVDALSKKLRQRQICCSAITDWDKRSLAKKFQILRQNDIVHFLNAKNSLTECLLAKLTGTAVINHWIGTDVLRASTNPVRALKARICAKLMEESLAVSSLLQTELKNIRVKSRVVPFCRLSPERRVAPLPEKFTVLTYLNPRKPEFYGAEIIRQLAYRFPEVEFRILALQTLGQVSPNIRCLGWREDVLQQLKQSSVLVRMTKHDGLPNMILEALSCGRQVIWSFDFPFCHKAHNLKEAGEILSRLIRDCPLNTEGADYVVQTYSQDTIIQDIIRVYEKLHRDKTRWSSGESYT